MQTWTHLRKSRRTEIVEGFQLWHLIGCRHENEQPMRRATDLSSLNRLLTLTHKFPPLVDDAGGVWAGVALDLGPVHDRQARGRHLEGRLRAVDG